ncbi:MAG: c-type cytochrome [Pyrinomonadaceae bacterium]|nr:c-type cytochrome [Pyrinomonadaceae bacterium]
MMKNKLKLAIIFSFAFIALAIFVPIGETQTKVKTASEEFKSITVLKDMPADQMGKVMNQMSASLGVNCNFCHAENDFAKEGFEHKDIAREMIKMTFELNKKYFNGRPEINCNSCHNGKAHPSPSFPLMPSKPAEERPKQPEKKPTIEEILAKYETALGGKTKLDKITTRHIKAQRIEPDNKTIEAEEIWTKGNKSLIKTIYPSKQDGDYIIKEIFDGTDGWKLGNDQKIELKADEIENIKRDAQIFANPNLKAIYAKLEFRLLDKLDGKDVYIAS